MVNFFFFYESRTIMTIINTWDSCDDLIRGTFGHVIQYSVPDLGSVQIGTRHESL